MTGQQKNILKINGLSFVASNKIPNTKDVLSVKNMHANWVALMPFGFMPSATKPDLSFNNKWQWKGETAEGIQLTSDLFHQHHIKRMLKPQIWVKKGVFTGFIEMKSERDWKSFEQNYRDFLLFYAILAEKESFDMLCIGTELKLFVKHRPIFWEQLIIEIKKVYKGQLTYAANWDSYKTPTFWDALDCIGIDAYFPLSTKQTPEVNELLRKWLPIKNELKSFSKKHQKKIIFTEYGYRSADYSTKEPWVSDTPSPYNPTAQINALKALYTTFWDEQWFEGGFLWKWFDKHETSGGLNHHGYTVQNKNSEHFVREFYKSNQSYE